MPTITSQYVVTNTTVITSETSHYVRSSWNAGKDFDAQHNRTNTTWTTGIDFSPGGRWPNQNFMAFLDDAEDRGLTYSSPLGSHIRPSDGDFVAANTTGATVTAWNGVEVRLNDLVIAGGSTSEYGLVRFTAPEAGVYTLNSTFHATRLSGYEHAIVLHNNTRIYDQPLVDSSYENPMRLSETVAMQRGDTLAFGGQPRFWGMVATVEVARIA